MLIHHSLLKNIKRTLSGVAAITAMTVAFTATAHAWDLKPVASTDKAGEVAYCVMEKNNPETGLTSFFALDGNGNARLILGFAENFLDINTIYKTTLMVQIKDVDDARFLPVVGKALKDDLLVIELNDAIKNDLSYFDFASMLSVPGFGRNINIMLDSEWHAQFANLQECAKTAVVKPRLPHAKKAVVEGDSPQFWAIKKVLDKAKVEYETITEVITDNPYAPVDVTWTNTQSTGTVYGAVETLAPAEGKSLPVIVEDYLYKLQPLCTKAFVSDVGRVEKLDEYHILRVDLACSTFENDSVSAILFLEHEGRHIMFLQETSADNAQAAIKARNDIAFSFKRINRDTYLSAE